MTDTIHECPKCGGDIWSNVRKNQDRMAQGQKPMPDYACKDKEGCGWKKWPPREEGQRRGQLGGGGKPKWTWGSLSRTYGNCLKLAVKHVGENVPDATPAETVAAAATLFITAARDGVQPIQKPEPEPQRPARSEDFPEALDDDDGRDPW
jgi:hypothetical protein